MSMFGLTNFLIKGYVKRKTNEKRQQGNTKIRFNDVKALKEMYDIEVKPYYEETQIQFNALCKAGKITLDELYLLKVLLEECLGTYAAMYKKTTFKK